MAGEIEAAALLRDKLAREVADLLSSDSPDAMQTARTMLEQPVWDWLSTLAAGEPTPKVYRDAVPPGWEEVDIGSLTGKLYEKTVHTDTVMRTYLVHIVNAFDARGHCLSPFAAAFREQRIADRRPDKLGTAAEVFAWAEDHRPYS